MMGFAVTLETSADHPWVLAEALEGNQKLGHGVSDIFHIEGGKSFVECATYIFSLIGADWFPLNLSLYLIRLQTDLNLIGEQSF